MNASMTMGTNRNIFAKFQRTIEKFEFSIAYAT